MGISFVDILIQVIFILLVALMAGYIDPVERLKIEQFEQAGKDLCNKLNQDSPEACREYIQGKKIGVLGELSDVGDTVCPRVGAQDSKSCIQAVDRVLGEGSQRPCLKTPLKNSIPPSTRWEVRPEEIIFLGFTPQYLDYLRKRADQKRLAIVQRLQEQVPRSFRLAEIDESFGFIREQGCFHNYSTTWGKYSESELKDAYLSLSPLKAFLKN
jgi:hypothetical protein